MQYSWDKYPAPKWNITESEETPGAYHILNSTTGVKLYADYNAATKYDTFTFEEKPADKYSLLKSFHIHPVGADSNKCVMADFDNLKDCYESSYNQFVIELPQE